MSYRQMIAPLRSDGSDFHNVPNGDSPYVRCPMMDRHILFTNLRAIQLNAFDLRFPCSALLLSDLVATGERECEARCFGPDPAWEIFKCELSSIDYKLIRSEVDRHAEGSPIPPGHLVTGVTLAFRFGPSFELRASDVEKPINVDEFKIYDGGYVGLWEIFHERVREHWHGPIFPVLDYRPFRRKGG